MEPSSVWRRATELGLTLALACALPACTSVEPFRCDVDAECAGTGGEAGRCEPDGFCSFPDSSCDGGHRYGTHSGDVADDCVCESSAVPVGSYSGTASDLDARALDVGRPL